MFDSFAAMTSTKLMQDQFEHRIYLLESDNKRIVAEKREQDVRLHEVSTQNNALLTDLRVLRKIHGRAMSQKEAA
jgi:hypothetical protein